MAQHPLSFLAAMGPPIPSYLSSSSARRQAVAHHCGPVGRSTSPRQRGSTHQRAQRRKARRAARLLRRARG